MLNLHSKRIFYQLNQNLSKFQIRKKDDSSYAHQKSVIIDHHISPPKDE